MLRKCSACSLADSSWICLAYQPCQTERHVWSNLRWATKSRNLAAKEREEEKQREKKLERNTKTTYCFAICKVSINNHEASQNLASDNGWSTILPSGFAMRYAASSKMHQSLRMRTCIADCSLEAKVKHLQNNWIMFDHKIENRCRTVIQTLHESALQRKNMSELLYSFFSLSVSGLEPLWKWRNHHVNKIQTENAWFVNQKPSFQKQELCN